MRDVIHPDLDAVLLAPLLREVVEPGVVRRHEMAPHQHAKARALDLGGRTPGIEHGQKGRAGGAGAGDLEEAPAAAGEMIGGTLARFAHWKDLLVDQVIAVIRYGGSIA